MSSVVKSGLPRRLAKAGRATGTSARHRGRVCLWREQAKGHGTRARACGGSRGCFQRKLHGSARSRQRPRRDWSDNVGTACEWFRLICGNVGLRAPGKRRTRS